MSDPAAVSNPFDTPGARQLAAWTLRLAGSDPFAFVLLADPHLFAMLYAACASAVPVPLQLRPQSAADPDQANAKVLQAMKELRRSYDGETSGRFAGLYLDGLAAHAAVAADRDRFMRLAAGWQQDAQDRAGAFLSAREANVDRLARLLSLDDAQRDLLLWQLVRDAPGFKQLFDLLLSSDATAVAALAVMLGVDQAAVRDALTQDSALVRSGLLRVHETPLRIEPVSAFLLACLTDEAPGDDEFFARFAVALEPAASTASLARLEDRDRGILLDLLHAARPEDRPVNALVYGPATVDKRDMLARMLADAALEAFTVPTRNVPPGELAARVFIAQRHLERAHPDAVLVIDRAEQALTARQGMSLMSLFGMTDDAERPDDEAGLSSDAGLTDSRVRCVWLTDRPRNLSERNLGRFLFHCEARPGSRGDRRERVGQVITEFGLSEDLEAHLAKYQLLGEAQVRQAVTLAELLADSDGGRDPVIRRAVFQAQKALGRERTEELRDSVTTYSLENLNVAGRFDPQMILRALRQRPGSPASICLFGLPGAGKTQLAEYLAVQLDLPIIMKSASDLLSKWLGESEQNIAAMFAEAEAEGALLFLDEADSFLRDRALARAEWSVTQVNELLQRMERHPGIFIAATNLMGDIDAAALRRFTWKLEFLALRPDQAWAMLCTEAGIDEASLENADRDGLRERLAAIANLTPGDFATVKRQANMLGEQLTPDGWLEQLAAEAKAKMAGLQRNKLGFG